ncbi:hypothetical protein CsatB_011908 [Cannabis sativa]
MGVGGKFWDLLKPYVRNEAFDFLRNKRVAVDLSFWIVQHETAIKDSVRNPHLRLTFFRTINLFSKFGAFPVFVIDGTPSPLKSKTRIARFYRSSGIESSSLPVPEDGVSFERNRAFTKCVQECVELLELMGMPILKANGEAEALCAQLNAEGHVDACITSDSDSFLFGAKCVIKSIKPNTKEPFECYYMSDIEAGLGLKRNHLIAISLLVGNDHDINGVQGIGLETALRFVRNFSEDDILKRLHEIGNKVTPPFQCNIKPVDDFTSNPEASSQKAKSTHCSFCGHPGSKQSHVEKSCEYCSAPDGGCKKKPEGFKCDCLSCDEDREEKERKKQEYWLSKVCSKIAVEPNFPNDELIRIYTCDSHGSFTGKNDQCLTWESPKTELLIDFLVFHQHWIPSYVRQMLFPMLSTIFLRETANHSIKSLLYGQFDFDSVDRVKIRQGHKFYVVKWRKDVSLMCSATPSSEEANSDIMGVDESISLLDELDAPMIRNDGGCQFLLTDENMELVHAAFPEEVNRFLRGKCLKNSQELKESKRKKSAGADELILETPKPRDVQLNITEFYRSTKVQLQAGDEEGSAKDYDSQSDGNSKGRRRMRNPNLSKSVRRRLLFD